MIKRNVTGRLLWSVACGIGLMGCGGATEVTSPESRSVGGAQVENAAPASSAAPARLTSVGTPPVLAPVEMQSAEIARGRELFQRLVSPGVSMEDWNQAHDDLVALGESVVPLLAEKLTEGTEPERELAGTTLALLGADAAQAIPALKAALQDSSRFVQANAAACLVQFPEHASDAVPTLVQLLKENDPQLRQLAAVNLNAAGVDVSAQLDLLKEILAQEESPDVLTPIIELVGRIGAAAEPLVPQLQKIAFEQSGDLGQAADFAIQQITEGAPEEPGNE